MTDKKMTVKWYGMACTRERGQRTFIFSTGRRLHGRQLIYKHSAQSASRSVQTLTWYKKAVLSQRWPRGYI